MVCHAPAFLFSTARPALKMVLHSTLTSDDFASTIFSCMLYCCPNLLCCEKIDDMPDNRALSVCAVNTANDAWDITMVICIPCASSPLYFLRSRFSSNQYLTTASLFSFPWSVRAHIDDSLSLYLVRVLKWYVASLSQASWLRCTFSVLVGLLSPSWFSLFLQWFVRAHVRDFASWHLVLLPKWYVLFLHLVSLPCAASNAVLAMFF